MIVLAIDPGPTESAFATLWNGSPDGKSKGKLPNAELLAMVKRIDSSGVHLAVEMIASYGMPVGAEVFDTCVWIGRFVEAWGGSFSFVYRATVKLHLCGTLRAKDSNVRQALLDRFGGKAVAMGSKATPGPLYGFAKDAWSALAVAVTYADGFSNNAPEANL